MKFIIGQSYTHPLFRDVYFKVFDIRVEASEYALLDILWMHSTYGYHICTEMNKRVDRSLGWKEFK